MFLVLPFAILLVTPAGIEESVPVQSVTIACADVPQAYQVIDAEFKEPNRVLALMLLREEQFKRKLTAEESQILFLLEVRDANLRVAGAQFQFLARECDRAEAALQEENFLQQQSS